MAQKVTVIDGKKTITSLRLVHKTDPKKPASLKARIQAAKTTDEIDALLVASTGYKSASAKTHKSWERAAAARRAELSKK